MEPRAGAEDDRRNKSGFWKDRAPVRQRSGAE